MDLGCAELSTTLQQSILHADLEISSFVLHMHGETVYRSQGSATIARHSSILVVLTLRAVRVRRAHKFMLLSGSVSLALLGKVQHCNI